MANTSILSTLLRHYANKQASAFVNFHEFSDYLKKYAAKHLEEDPNLAQYIEVSDSLLLKKLDDLSARHEIFILNRGTPKMIVVVITFYSVYFAKRYKEMLSTVTIPFPTVSDLPKQLPIEAIEKQSATEFIPSLIENQDTKSPALYCLLLPRDIPAVLFPVCVPINFVIRAAMAKIRHMLKKDEYHDYFQKKLRNSNPNKEIASRTFFTKFIQHPDNADQNFDIDVNAFYFWNQLCYFIRQDFEKIKDRTAEDTNIIQAVAVSEIWMMSLKDKASKEQAKQEALNELEGALAKPPFFFSMDSILKFTDSKGALLYGQYDEDDLKGCLKKLTTDCADNELPKLLVFKIENGSRYFIYKAKVFQLIIRLANEAHDVIEKNLTDKWFKYLSNYKKLPEMHDQKAFEETVKNLVKELSPVLYALLNANFLTLLNYETNHIPAGTNFNIFSGGKLETYTNLLMLKSSSILANAKLMLPFWYTIPFISWLASLFFKKKNEPQLEKKPQKEFTADDIPDDVPKKQGSKKDRLAQAAKEISEGLIPAGSSIDRELDSYRKQWNKMISKDANMQLTDDVNSLIRDYMRKVIKTISVQTFNQDRVQNLAETLVNTPNMQKIGEQDALLMYVQLYILRLLTNK